MHPPCPTSSACGSTAANGARRSPAGRMTWPMLTAPALPWTSCWPGFAPATEGPKKPEASSSPAKERGGIGTTYRSSAIAGPLRVFESVLTQIANCRIPTVQDSRGQGMTGTSTHALGPLCVAAGVERLNTEPHAWICLCDVPGGVERSQARRFHWQSTRRTCSRRGRQYLDRVFPLRELRSEHGNKLPRRFERCARRDDRPAIVNPHDVEEVAMSVVDHDRRFQIVPLKNQTKQVTTPAATLKKRTHVKASTSTCALANSSQGCRWLKFKSTWRVRAPQILLPALPTRFNHCVVRGPLPRHDPHVRRSTPAHEKAGLGANPHRLKTFRVTRSKESFHVWKR